MDDCKLCYNTGRYGPNGKYECPECAPPTTITPRDFFAGMMAPHIYGYPGCNLNPAGIAREAYEQADAMMKERERS